MKKCVLILFLLMAAAILPVISAQEDKTVCFVYFTGVGCPHCAKTDPVLVDLLKKYPNTVAIEYEIYQQGENAQLLLEYNNKYDSGLGVPLIILSKEKHIAGDYPILNNLDIITKAERNSCPLINGSSVNFENLDLIDLPGKPKIWMNDRILIKVNEGGNNELLRNLLTAYNISSVLEGVNYKIVDPQPVPLSGKNIYFENAIELNGWIFQWNGEKIVAHENQTGQNDTKVNVNKTAYKNQTGQNTDGEEIKTKLTLVKLVSLAAVDAVNPCALAVLTLMLIAILTYNPKKKRNVLLAGLAFTISVFVMYLFYGLIIIKFFQVVQTLTAIRLWLYKILGFFAIILGILNIKDFARYKPGGFATEMPLSLRPKVKKIISRITSPKGAFGVGIFVTLFLLPCTIGPYVIAGGILSAFEIIKTIPPLLLYNLIFVMPMIAITLIVYAGFAKVEDVSGWKEKNIRKLHLIAGIIMLILGAAMIFGWV